MEKVKLLYKRYKELILYVFFGGLTTLCNILVYTLLAYPFKLDELSSTLLAWLVSVIFAYLTNRRWVFESKASGAGAITLEASKFMASRLFSGGVDLGIMAVFVTILGFNDVIIKILSNIIVIVMNFVLSKLFVFKSSGAKKTKATNNTSLRNDN